MNTYSVSIIIPCYNCSGTLEQAFESCFTQDITVPYEIIMVDDASTDDTREVMKRLAQGKSNVKVLYHEVNKGGGATRNTATRACSSDIIYCLDSDNLLPKGTVGKMYQMIVDKKCDGVGIHRSIKFKGNDINDISHINVFNYVNEVIPFEGLIGNGREAFCTLYSTFMFTKQAFEIAGGYAEDHGFDTQSFAWRFLGNGLITYVCPDTSDLHRVQYNKSYYLREYESGKINHNWFKIFQEFLFVFNEETQMEILNFKLNNTVKLLSEHLNKKTTPIFKQNYQVHLKHNARDEYEKYLATQKDISTGDLYWLGVKKFKDGKFAQAYDIFEKLVGGGLQNGYAHYYLKEASQKLGKESASYNEEIIARTFSYNKHGSEINILTRIGRKLLILTTRFFHTLWHRISQ